MDVKTQTVYRHKKRGTEYTVTDVAHVQAAAPISEGDVVVVYRGRDGNTWVRPASEFADGRFEPVEDFKLRDKIAAAFIGAHRTWKGNEPHNMLVNSPSDAQALAQIAVTIFRNEAKK